MRRLLALVFAIFLLVVAGLTNPSRMDHQSAVAKTFNQENPVAGFFGIGDVLSEFVAYNDYGVFSMTSLEGRNTSFGAFGLVFPYPPEFGEVQQAVLNRLPKHLKEKLPQSIQDHLPDTLVSPEPEGQR